MESVVPSERAVSNGVTGGRGIQLRSIARRKNCQGEGDVVNPSQRTHKGQRGNSVCVRTAAAGGKWSSFGIQEIKCNLWQTSDEGGKKGSSDGGGAYWSDRSRGAAAQGDMIWPVRPEKPVRPN